ncbi:MULTISPECIES: hypothetical protein [Xanthomonas]|uniref:Uncharacterized protein n=1 Tax=Xanthomonas rydalmerensis TaxID=3046274 RepID=A0ABZ0JRB6_9XANT|nr:MULTISPECIES: hypothetical protein [unclassified Xanthomonas]MBB5944172.1 hypothetical protein [Xanthomonas sp. 3307]MXV06955.1 hypothetical protein [Xanthomonas sp. LMG 9002]WOS41662.1 hypothetical protein QN243_04140 [Xanthomonas sp. DM-2023]WOS45848.1 hypothetical protein QN242_04140 [Xanthomonas sp. DM-2023]WOS50027.1 hypothetical protein QN240_04140 [Xanthomonas sp. DM-2023]
MPIAYRKRSATLAGVVSVEDAETLLAWLQANRNAKLNCADCEHLHTAVLQALMATQAGVSAWPKDSQLRQWLHSALHP